MVRAAIPELPALTAEEERYAAGLWAVHREAVRSAVAMSFAGITYKTDDRDPHALAQLPELPAEIAQAAQDRDIVGEKPAHRIHAEPARGDIEAPRLLVFGKDIGPAGIEPEPHLPDEQFRQRGDVAKSEIEALPGERMNEMSSVANQREARADEPARDAKAERERAGG